MENMHTILALAEAAKRNGSDSSAIGALILSQTMSRMFVEAGQGMTDALPEITHQAGHLAHGLGHMVAPAIISKPSCVDAMVDIADESLPGETPVEAVRPRATGFGRFGWNANPELA